MVKENGSMTELTKQCLNLPFDRRARLAKILNESLFKGEDMATRRFYILLPIAENLVGVGVLDKTKDIELVIGRRMIAYQMRQEGFSLQTIGTLLGKHHTTIMHMVNMMEDAIKFQFRPELTYWEEFQQKLKEHEEKVSSKVV